MPEAVFPRKNIYAITSPPSVEVCFWYQVASMRCRNIVPPRLLVRLAPESHAVNVRRPGGDYMAEPMHAS